MKSKNDRRFFKYYPGDGGDIKYELYGFKAFLNFEGVKCNKCDKSKSTTIEYQLFYGTDL